MYSKKAYFFSECSFLYACFRNEIIVAHRLQKLAVHRSLSGWRARMCQKGLAALSVLPWCSFVQGFRTRRTCAVNCFASSARGPVLAPCRHATTRAYLLACKGPSCEHACEYVGANVQPRLRVPAQSSARMRGQVGAQPPTDGFSGAQAREARAACRYLCTLVPWEARVSLHYCWLCWAGGLCAAGLGWSVYGSEN